MALNRTIERYKNGAMTKDLFYYLVRHPVINTFLTLNLSDLEQ